MYAIRSYYARHERRPSPELQLFRQYVGGVRPQVGAEVLGDLGLRELLEIIRQLPLGIAPGEVGIRLRESHLREPVHDLGPGERLGEKDGLGIRQSYNFV